MRRRGTRIGWVVLSWIVTGCGGISTHSGAELAGGTGATASAEGGRIQQGAGSPAGQSGADGSSPDSPSGGAAQAGGGATVGAGGVQNVAGTSNLSRVVRYPPTTGSRPKPILCHDDACPNGERCFPITTEFGICAPANFSEATECSPESPTKHDPDECGCNDLRCPDDQQCRVVEQYCSCASTYSNRCAERACETPADCGEDLCIPSTWIWGPRCAKAKCKSDADCDEHSGMRCVAMLEPPSQAGEERFKGTQCVFNQEPVVSDTCKEVVRWAADAFTCN